VSALLSSLRERINAATSREELDAISETIWRVYWGSGLNDAEAQSLADMIQARWPQRGNIVAAISNSNARVISRFAPRPCRKRLTGDERAKRRNRKRMLGGSSAMPDTIRHHYTEGERAALCIVAFEVKRHGICDLSIDEIADRAGVGRTTVQNAMHEARRLAHLVIKERPQRGAKNLTNIVEISSIEWRTWIKRAPSAARDIGSKIFKNVSTSESIDIKNRDSTKAVATYEAEVETLQCGNCRDSRTLTSAPRRREGAGQC
jgi:predicted DNA-binding protein (UPF0251 family)